MYCPHQVKKTLSEHAGLSQDQHFYICLRVSIRGVTGAEWRSVMKLQRED